jgi:hypothetical protein
MKTESKRNRTVKKRDKTLKKTLLDEAHEAIAMIKEMGVREVKEASLYEILLLTRAEYAQEKYDARYM